MNIANVCVTLHAQKMCVETVTEELTFIVGLQAIGNLMINVWLLYILQLRAQNH